MTALINLSTLADHHEGTGLEHFNVLEQMHKEFFPEGMAWVSLQTDNIIFKSTIRNKSQWVNGIEHNDPMRSIINISKIEDDKFEVELYSGSSLMTKPAKGSTNYFGRADCKLRKFKGNFEQVIKKIRLWEEKRLQVVEDNKDNMKS